MDKRPEAVAIRGRQRQDAAAGLDQLGGAIDDRVERKGPPVIKEDQFGDGAGDDATDGGGADRGVIIIITPQDAAQA